jgi:hypothetical protein
MQSTSIKIPRRLANELVDYFEKPTQQGFFAALSLVSELKKLRGDIPPPLTSKTLRKVYRFLKKKAVKL